MKRNLILLALSMLNKLTVLAYDRHGRDYSVNGSRGSSTTFLIVGVIILFLIIWFNTDNKDKK